MTIAHHDHPSAEESAALYLAGAFPPGEALAFEARLAAGWPEAEAELKQLEAAVLALAADCPPIEPPAGAKDAILARLPTDPRAADRLAARGMTGSVFRFAEDGAGDFGPTPSPGVTIRLLNIDRERDQFSCLLRFAAGAVLHSHPHDGPEECIVLEGDLTVGQVRMKAGDYQRVEPGVDHIEQRSEGGALLYVTAPLAIPGRPVGAKDRSTAGLEDSTRPTTHPTSSRRSVPPAGSCSVMHPTYFYRSTPTSFL
jgi:anti-sigma factor ChrR (cupin superfamily)